MATAACWRTRPRVQVKPMAVRRKVVIFGSLNMDLVVRVPRMPRAGETLSAHGFLSNPGGKGANQAMACERQGGPGGDGRTRR